MRILYNTLCSSLIFLLSANAALANDSEYFMHGDQLIPLQQNDISIQKEVLNITQIERNIFLVDVNYTFYNPSQEQTLLVGFEARAPRNYYGISGDDPQIGTTHPFLEDFSVVLNGVKLPYQTALVSDKVALNPPILDTYNLSHIKVKNGEVHGLSEQQVAKLDYEMGEEFSFSYAYYFKATFKPGKNTLRHQYRFSYGESVGHAYQMGYLLTPANRWENKQIDDFTLNIYLKSLDGVLIERNFFNDASHWTSDGQLSTSLYTDFGRKVMQFNGDGKVLTFHKNNFHPQGELYLYKGGSEIDYTDLIPDLGYCFANLSYYNDELFEACKNATAFELKVLRNLPFAKRGYVFVDKTVQKYYQDNQKWYQANPTYQADMKDFTNEEVNWVNYWKSQ